MERSMLSEINRLRQMTVAELQAEWLRLYGEPSRSRNRDFLWRRLAWRVQELAHGGLSDRARARIDELAPDTFVRARVPATAPQMPASATESRQRRPVRDLRLPTPGSVITKQWRGREIEVVVRDDGFEWDGQLFTSLSAVARAVTGARWNGHLFFGLTARKRK